VTALTQPNMLSLGHSFGSVAKLFGYGLGLGLVTVALAL